MGATARIAQEGDRHRTQQPKRGTLRVPAFADPEGDLAADSTAQEGDITSAAADATESKEDKRRDGRRHRRTPLTPHFPHPRLGARHIRACTD